MAYKLQDKPVVVPVPDGKTIEEHFGKLASADSTVSIAHMIAPSGWGEPFQQPDFDEYTLVSSGRKSVEVDGEKLTVMAGQSILIKKGSRVRYSNPFPEECSYWSVCIPAFSMEAVHRDEG